jgi:magnesium-transporting ATPase (P-type)
VRRQLWAALADPGPLLHNSGPELAQLGAVEFCDAARRCSVLGKLTPGQKARVVAALKGANHTGGCGGSGSLPCAAGLRSKKG